MVKTLERHRYALCEKHVIVPFCCSYQVYRYLAGCFGLISCRHYLDETEEEIILQISMERKMHICKRCGGKTDRIHDYRVREVRDLELRGKPVRLLYRRRRYACPA